MNPRPIVQRSVGRHLYARRDPQHSIEGAHRPEATVEAKGELVEVRLEVLGRHPVVRPEQPRIEVPEHDVDHRHVGLALRMVPLDGEWVVRVAAGRQPVVAGPPVRANNGPPQYGSLDEGFQCQAMPTGHYLEAEPPGDGAPPMPAPVLRLRLPGRQVRVGTWGILSRSHFDSAGNQRLVVAPPALALGRATDEGLVHFDGPFPADGILLWSHHRRPQLVKHLEGRLVPRHSEELLELEGAHAGCMGRDQPSAPEPGGDRDFRPMHDGPSGQTRLVLVRTATEDDRAAGDAVGRPGVPAR